MLVCGLANASDAVEVLCISFLLPSAECELKLTTSDKGWLSAIMFIGKQICTIKNTRVEWYSDFKWLEFRMVKFKMATFLAKISAADVQ